jgi:hypothetical protein
MNSEAEAEEENVIANILVDVGNRPDNTKDGPLQQANDSEEDDDDDPFTNKENTTKRRKTLTTKSKKSLSKPQLIAQIKKLEERIDVLEGNLEKKHRLRQKMQDERNASNSKLEVSKDKEKVFLREINVLKLGMKNLENKDYDSLKKEADAAKKKYAKDAERNTTIKEELRIEKQNVVTERKNYALVRGKYEAHKNKFNKLGHKYLDVKSNFKLAVEKEKLLVGQLKQFKKKEDEDRQRKGSQERASQRREQNIEKQRDKEALKQEMRDRDDQKRNAKMAEASFGPHSNNTYNQPWPGPTHYMIVSNISLNIY